MIVLILFFLVLFIFLVLVLFTFTFPLNLFQIVIGEGFAQVISSQSDAFHLDHLKETREARVFGSFVVLIVLIPFFWLYFDSIDPNVLLDKERASIAQMSHLFLFLSLSIVATALNQLLSIWMCNNILAASTVHQDGPYNVPVYLEWYFSISLAVATLVRGVIESHAKRLNGLEAGWWTPKERCSLFIFNVFRSIVLCIIPLLSARPFDPTPVSHFLIISAGISILSIVLDVVVYSKIQARKEVGASGGEVSGPSSILVQLLSQQVNSDNNNNIEQGEEEVE